MKRFLSLAMYVMLLAAVLAPAQSAGAQDGGNADAAHACQDGGYLDLARSDGSGFANTGECVSYAAQGGELVVVSEGGGDEGGGGDVSCPDFATLAPVENSTDAFDSEQDCIDYINAGGEVVAYSPPPEVVLFNMSGTHGFLNCNIGVALKHFPANTVIEVTFSNAFWGVSTTMSLTTNFLGAVEPSALIRVIQGTWTASATTGGQTYSDAAFIDC